MKIKMNRHGGIEFRNNSIFLFIGIGALMMSVEGIVFFSDVVQGRIVDYSDILGIVFISVWLLIVFGMAIFSLIMFSKVLKLTDNGIICNSIFKKKHIDWSDVKDWGLSYCGQTRGEGNTYYLYFSKEILKAKNDEKKKMKGKVIKLVVLESEYYEIVDKVLSYCKEHIEVAPFVPEIKNHIF